MSLSIDQSSEAARWPRYAFGHPVGPVHRWFAWHPIKLWYGRWVWMQWTLRRRIEKNAYLDGPDWFFWCYNDPQDPI